MTTDQSTSDAVPTLKRIILTGFMGSGKTTVGRMLSHRLGWNFLDLDSEIERRCGLPVPEIFAQFGEPHFRTQEASTLADILRRSELVLALGGGAPETDSNRHLLRNSPHTAVVFLDAPFDILNQRCLDQAARPGATSRPLMADLAAAKKRYEDRRKLYENIATLHLQTASLSREQTLEELMSALLQPAG